MDTPATFEIGTTPSGYGGDEEVSSEQACAYAEALAQELRTAFPEVDVRLGEDLPVAAMTPDQLRLYGWVQRNWRRVRAEVNAAHGWPEQEGGRLLADHRCL